MLPRAVPLPPRPGRMWQGAHRAIRKAGAAVHPLVLTHRREPLGTGVVGEVGEVFGKKSCGLQKGFVVIQVKRIIWGGGKKKKRKSLQLSCMQPL